MESKLKHLEMIQAVITRMAGNSFLLKGWSVTLVAALFALAAANANHAFVFLGYFPVFVFWLLDGFYLGQERKFRNLYDHVRDLDADDVDFSMSTKRFCDTRSSWACACFSVTILIFHGVVFGSVVIVMLLALTVPTS